MLPFGFSADPNLPVAGMAAANGAQANGAGGGAGFAGELAAALPDDDGQPDAASPGAEGAFEGANGGDLFAASGQGPDLASLGNGSAELFGELSGGVVASGELADGGHTYLSEAAAGAVQEIAVPVPAPLPVQAGPATQLPPEGVESTLAAGGSSPSQGLGAQPAGVAPAADAGSGIGQPQTAVQPQSVPGGDAGSQGQAVSEHPAAPERRWRAELPEELRSGLVPQNKAGGLGSPVNPAVNPSVNPSGAPSGGLPAAGSQPAPAQGADGAPTAVLASAANGIDPLTAGVAAGGNAALPPSAAAQLASAQVEAGNILPGAPNSNGLPSGKAAPEGAAQVNRRVAASGNLSATSGPVAAFAATASDAALAGGQPNSSGQVSGAANGLTGEPEVASAAKADGPVAANTADRAPVAQGTGQASANVSVDGLAAAVLATGFTDGEASAGALPDGDWALALDGQTGARTGDMAAQVRTAGLNSPTQGQSGHVAAQVAGEIARNLQNGQTKFQMRFDPPELGRVEVTMKVGADGAVQAHLIVERPETLDMFLRDQRGLERALEAAGLSADQSNLEFSLRDGSNQDFGSGDGERSMADEGFDGGEQTAEAEPVDEIVRYSFRAGPEGLDIRI